MKKQYDSEEFVRKQVIKIDLTKPLIKKPKKEATRMVMTNPEKEATGMVMTITVKMLIIMN